MSEIICRYCDKPIEGESVPARAYWASVNQRSHPECLIEGFKAEAYECQKIDADCNDCIFFEARKSYKDFRYGVCGRGSRHPELPDCAIDSEWPNVVARPVFCSRYPCFVHRRDAP